MNSTTETLEFWTEQYTVGEEILDKEIKESDFGDGNLYNLHTDTSTAEHVLVVLFFEITGLVGNSITIHIYRRSRYQNEGQAYIILLAALDIFALMFSLPQLPFIKYIQANETLNFQSILLFNCMALGYIWIMVTMTLERAIAVYKPLKCKQIRRRLRVTMAGFGILAFVFFIGGLFYARKKTAIRELVTVISLWFVYILFFSVVLISYPAIIYKLYKRDREMSGLAHTRANGVNKNKQEHSKTRKEDSSHTTSFTSRTTSDVMLSSGKEANNGEKRRDLKNVHNVSKSSSNTITDKPSTSLETTHEDISEAKPIETTEANGNESSSHSINVLELEQISIEMIPDTNKVPDNTNKPQRNTTKKTSQIGNVSGVSDNTRNSKALDRKQLALHVTTVKTFIAVLIIYVMSNVPAILVTIGVVNNFHIFYTYYFNHVSNPVAYFIISKQFRTDVIKLLRK